MESFHHNNNQESKFDKSIRPSQETSKKQFAIKRVKEVLKMEANEILRASERVGEEVAKVAELILNSSGRVVVSGMGKNHFIAEKIAATLNSTGINSVFLHPAEAIHGDLGMVSKDDLIIFISKSGFTSEVLSILPSIKNIGSKMVAMVGNLESKLAKEADYVLDISVNQEACSLDIIPTSSTTLALAMGDALAMVLMDLRDFKIEDFAKNHPGGQIGKRIYLKIKDIMIKESNLLPKLSPDASMETILTELTEKNLGAVVITEESNNKMLGIISDGDLKRALKNKEKFFSLTAQDIMTRNPVSIQPNGTVDEAIQLMEGTQDRKIYVLPVCDENNYYVGLIRMHDLF